MTNAIPGTLTGPYMTPNRRFVVDDKSIRLASVEIDTTARDAGNTTYRTTFLRQSLALGKVTATGKYKEYAPAAGDGTETIDAILNENVDLLDPWGVAFAGPVMATVVIGGYIDADQVLLIDAAGKTDLRTAGFLLVEDY